MEVYNANLPMMFIGIVLGMTALTFLVLGGKKAFFEP